MTIDKTYMSTVIHKLAEDIKAKEMDYGMNGLKVQISFNLTEAQVLLDALKEQTSWISCDDRLPKEDTDVWIQYGPSMMVGYYKKDYTVYSPGYEDLDDTGWYDEHDEFICSTYDVVAWMPLPERYKPESKEEV